MFSEDSYRGLPRELLEERLKQASIDVDNYQRKIKTRVPWGVAIFARVSIIVVVSTIGVVHFFLAIRWDGARHGREDAILRKFEQEKLNHEISHENMTALRAHKSKVVCIPGRVDSTPPKGSDMVVCIGSKGTWTEKLK